MDELRARIAETLRDVEVAGIPVLGSHVLGLATDAMVALVGEPVARQVRIPGGGVYATMEGQANAEACANLWSARHEGHTARVVPLFAITSEEPEDA